mmetsp:Transcript_70019/g.227910  ORF Transcript_70019/g.227910 Transcript_70019/m.227910 type:complete len:145 (-) Transcript_70019:84-518(-)
MVVNRKRVPGKRSNATAVKKRDKSRKKIAKRKEKKEKKVTDLADLLASSTKVGEGSSAFAPVAAAGPGSGSRKSNKDADMKDTPAPAQATQSNFSKADLKKKLRAKIAGHSLDRTFGQEKGLVDSNGLKIKQKKPRNKEAMDTK